MQQPVIDDEILRGSSSTSSFSLSDLGGCEAARLRLETKPKVEAHFFKNRRKTSTRDECENFGKNTLANP